jgi:hypothetical protein
MDESSEPTSDDTTVAAAEPRPATAPAATRGVSRATLVISVLLALLVGGVVGAAVGWKVEQERVKDDLSSIRPIGTVTAVDEDSVTLRMRTSDGERTYAITAETELQGADELTEGATVLVRRSSGDGDERAARVLIVLPEADADGS